MMTNKELPGTNINGPLRIRLCLQTWGEVLVNDRNRDPGPETQKNFE